jgi:hypothetical protein
MAANVGERVITWFQIRLCLLHFYCSLQYGGVASYSVTFFLRDSDTHLHCSLTLILSARWNIQPVQRYLM